MPLEIDGKEFKEYAADVKSGKLTARFQLYKPVPFWRITEDGKRKGVNASFSFNAEYTRLTRNGGSEHVRYYTTKTRRETKGEISFNYQPFAVVIENDELVVNLKTQKDLYWFLLNHPDNLTNPMYDKEGKSESELRDIEAMMNFRRTPFLFFEVQPSRSAAKELKDKALKAEVVSLINSDKFTVEHVKTMYKAYNLPDSDDLIIAKEWDTMRLALVGQAEANPEQFLKSFEDNTLNLKAYINDAVNLEVLIFEVNKVRFHKTANQYKGNICAIPEEDWDKKEDYLREWLRTNKKGAEIVEQIKEEITYARKGEERKVWRAQ